MAKSMWSVIVIYILLTGSTSSQDISDHSQIEMSIQEAWNLLNQSQYEASILKYQEAKELATTALLWDKVFQCENEIIGALWRQYRVDESLSRARKSLPDIVAKLGSNSLPEGKLYHNMATANQLKGYIDSALYYYEKASAILEEHEDDGLKALSAVYNNLGAIYRNQGNFNKAFKYLSKSLETDIEYFGKDHIYVANGFMNIGAIYEGRSLYNSALEYFLKSIEILKKIGNTSDLYSTVLLNIGSIYMRKEQYTKAHDYQLQALRNNIRIFGESHLTNCIFYKGIGDNLSYQSLFDSSQVYYNKILQFEDELETNDPYMAMSFWQGLSRIQLGLQQEEKAISSINKSIKIANKLSKKNSHLNYLNNDLGLIYLNTGNYAKAKKCFQLAISLYESEYESKHTILTGPYRNMSEVYTFEKDYLHALEYVQKSISANHNQWKHQNLYDNPDFDGIEHKINYLFSLEQKIKILNLLYQTDNNPKYLYTSLDTYKSIDEVIRQLRKKFTEITDKGRFQEITNHVYEDAIIAHFKAYKLTKDENHLNKCYYYSETSKVGILSDAISTIDARSWSNLPVELLKLEEENKANIAYYQSLLNRENLAKVDKDSSKIILYENELFRSRRTLDSIISIFETKYQSYYQLKYKDSIISVFEMQNHLPDGTKLIEYFLGDSASYAFVVTKQDFFIEEIDLLKTIPTLIEKFRNEIDIDRRLNSDYTGNSNAYLDIGYQLYNKLVEPILKTENKVNADKLIIIPDAELGYFPFELLVTENTNSVGSNPLEYPYLIKDYAISYSYSSTLLFQQTNPLGKGTSYLSFAPSYNNVDNTSDKIASLGKFRHDFLPLDWNQKEASLIHEFDAANSFIGNRATERTFKKIGSNAKVLHLAMHAFIDDDNPMNSKLVFYQDDDSIEDGYLHTFELYNMRLNADLAILSACNTGYGKLVNGEGIMSLARGFVYAGVPSVVMSHWQVDDQSTQALMEHFYANLSKGMQKSDALRQAKLKYLEQASPNKQHPFFWGAFVVLGDDSSIIDHSINSDLYYGLPIVLLLLVVIIYLKTIKTRKGYL